MRVLSRGNEPARITRPRRPAARTDREWRKQSTIRESPTLLWLSAPAVVVYACFLLGPALFGVVMTTYRWNTGSSASFVGLSNWRAFFLDPAAHRALFVSAEIIGLRFILDLPLSLALGIYIAGRQRYRAVLAALYVIPLLFSGVGVGVMWVKFFAPEFGALQNIFAQDWLAQPFTALLIDTAVLSWQTIPFYMLIVQAARRSIPESLYEASALDGAGPAMQCWRITLPQLRNTIGAIAILCVASSMTAFASYYVMTSGGPAGATTNLALGMYYTAFDNGQLGYAAVFGITLSILGFLLAIAVSRIGRFNASRSVREGIQ